MCPGVTVSRTRRSHLLTVYFSVDGEWRRVEGVVDFEDFTLYWNRPKVVFKNFLILWFNYEF